MVSLFELNEHLRRVVALNFPQALWIRAEIAQMGESKGHFYIELVQKNEEGIVAQASAALWASEYRQLYKKLGLGLQTVLREGLEVKMLVRPDFHERYGLKLHISDIDPAFTLGQLDLQRRQTVQTLRESGLLDKNRSLALKPVLQRIALISSETAAGRQDFLRQLEENHFGYRFGVQFFQASVQGKDAAAELVAALKKINQMPGQFDCAVLVRGGGSRLDLSAFDALELCTQVAQMSVPVLAGIGHDVDETVLDLVVYRSLKTPTAVAEFIIQHNLAFEGHVLETVELIRILAQNRLNFSKLQLEQAQTEARWSVMHLLRARAMQLKTLEQNLPGLTRQYIAQQYRNLDQIDVYCKALHPDEVLKRGFSITRKNGKVVRAVDGIKSGDILETQLQDGKIISKSV